MLDITINKKKYKISKNYRWNILQLCNALQIKIPVFCFHEKLNVAGNCRMCLVEVEKAPKPIVACATPLLDKMNIFTNTPLVKKARENVLELLLINHPLDCPICDQGGECDLQENTKEYASERIRFFLTPKRRVEDKNLGHIIKTIMTRCIQCTRCVRFIEEYTEDNSLKALGRGMQTEISTYLQKIIRTEWSGNLIDICPVGALTSKTYAFMGRPWELRKNKSVDTTDVFGSEIYVFAKKNGNITAFDKKKSNFIEKEAVLRILPVFNNSLNEHWIHDKTRFRHDGNAFQRLSNINFVSLLKKNVFLETKTLAWDFYLKKTVLQSKNFAISKKKPTSFVSLKLKYFL